jgi:GNAT superfamily N-acetyltransferase
MQSRNLSRAVAYGDHTLRLSEISAGTVAALSFPTDSRAARHRFAARAATCQRPAAALMTPDQLHWKPDLAGVDWDALSHLYRIAPLGEKKPDDLRVSFGNSRYTCLILDGDTLVGAGRALADGVDCSYLCDVAVHPDYQGIGLGKAIIQWLRDQSAGHRKIILYANPGKEGFYAKLGFRRMRTAMAIFANQQRAMETGLVD